MRHPNLSRTLPLLLLIAALALSACSALPSQLPPSQPAGEPAGEPTGDVLSQPAGSETSPTTVPPFETTVETSGIPAGPITDLDTFKQALLQAIMAQDTALLQTWMTEPFLTGGWRADAWDSSPADALTYLYGDEIVAAGAPLQIVHGADLKTLMGGLDPLSIPRPEAGVVDAALVSGWGKDGRDEAVLFISRGHDNALYWHGWLTIKGGMSGARTGGIKSYTNPTYGFSFFIPRDYVGEGMDDSQFVIMAPGEGHPGEGRAAVIVHIEPANGRTVDQVVEQVKADIGPGFEIGPGTALGLDKATAIVLSGLPGQDANRRMLFVYNDMLYDFTFVPDNPNVPAAYWQMEDLYAMIVNTFHFTN